MLCMYIFIDTMCMTIYHYPLLDSSRISIFAALGLIRFWGPDLVLELLIQMPLSTSESRAYTLHVTKPRTGQSYAILCAWMQPLACLISSI